MPPVVKTGGMDIFKTDELFREGKVAMNIEWIGFAESSINPETSKVADKVAFAQAPGLKGPDGKLIRWANIGGQPFVIMTWATDLQIKEAVDFVKWWLSPEVQHMFAAAGGQSAIKSVYNDPKYVTYRPWNRTWAPGLEWQKDTWHIPEFFELLVQGQEQYRPRHHRQAGRQDDARQHRRLPGEAPEGSRTHRGLAVSTDDAAVRRCTGARSFVSARRADDGLDDDRHRSRGRQHWRAFSSCARTTGRSPSSLAIVISVARHRAPAARGLVLGGARRLRRSPPRPRSTTPGAATRAACWSRRRSRCCS